MRLKKVKDADVFIDKSFYIIKDPFSYKGNYNKLFKNDNNISVEIGMAKLHPDINFIGIEMFDSVIVRAVQKLENENIPNLRLIRMDAKDINDVFDHEIDTIYLNFSDPWPKKRHAKRRLTSKEFLKRYDSVFKDEKKIFQKTDNEDLFAYSINSLSEYGYTLRNVTLNLHKEEVLDNVETEYEKRFKEKNVHICRLEAYKK